MSKKKRNYNIRLIRSRRSYSISEIADLFNIHIRTVQTWHKDGLTALDESSKPFLFMGSELKRFLAEKRKVRKIKLKEDEFYCPRCRTGRISKIGKISFIRGGREMGLDDEQILIKGECTICDCILTRFSTINNLKNSFFGQFFTENAIIIKGNQSTSLNTDISGVKKNEK